MFYRLQRDTEQLTKWIQLLSKTLSTMQGITVFRSMTFNQQSLGNILADGSMLILMLNSTFYMIIGCAIFIYCEKWSQKNGILGHY